MGLCVGLTVGLDNVSQIRLLVGRDGEFPSSSVLQFSRLRKSTRQVLVYPYRTARRLRAFLRSWLL